MDIIIEGIIVVGIVFFILFLMVGLYLLIFRGYTWDIGYNDRVRERNEEIIRKVQEKNKK